VPNRPTESRFANRLHDRSPAAQERLLDKLRKRHASICSYQADPVRRPAS